MSDVAGSFNKFMFRFAGIFLALGLLPQAANVFSSVLAQTAHAATSVGSGMARATIGPAFQATTVKAAEVAVAGAAIGGGVKLAEKMAA
jgi:hypothetical protein